MTEEKEKTKSGVSRREFIAGAAALGAAAGMTTLIPQVTAASPFVKSATTLNTAGGPKAATPLASGGPKGLPSSWDYSTDVVVVGYGLGGATSALEAARAGANVIVLEKASAEYAGGNSKIGGSMIFHPTDVIDGINYLKACQSTWGGTVSDDMLQVWAEGMVANVSYLASFGASFTSPVAVFEPEHPGFPGASAVQGLSDSHGKSPWYYLTTAVAAFTPATGQSAPKIFYDTPGTALAFDGQVKGVYATQSGNPIAVQAKRAVILACGGFEANDDMKRNYVDAPIWPYGTIYNTGDGIRMAQQVGADLWHMNNFMGPNRVGTILPQFPNIPWASNFTSYVSGKGTATYSTNYIFVDHIWGNRFMNERLDLEHSTGHGMSWKIINWYDGNGPQEPQPYTEGTNTGSVVNDFPYNPLWIVFDDTARKAGPICYGWGWANFYTNYTWSGDNSAEIASGAILQAPDIPTLATYMKVNPSTLQATLTRYNGFCSSSPPADLDFGRPAVSLTPINTPPYCAALSVPCMVNTQGGPRRNASWQVVDPNLNPIPRLYSAGEMGSVYAWLYNGGGNQGECMVGGRIAGANAAAETPWA